MTGAGEVVRSSVPRSLRRLYSEMKCTGGDWGTGKGRRVEK